MSDTVLTYEKRIDVSKNIFLDREYFEELEKNKEIQNCVGKYKKIWDRQDGKCAICGREIQKEQTKALIFKRVSKDKTIKNMSYVHDYCKDSIVEYVDVEDNGVGYISVKEIISEIKNEKNTQVKESKFINLEAYFHNLRKINITLTFKDIEKKLGFKLCDSAYKYRSYFTNNKEGMISNSWISQGYVLTKVDMKNQKLSFKKEDFRRRKVQIPKFLYRLDLPTEAIDEIKVFFQHIKEKYRLK